MVRYRIEQQQSYSLTAVPLSMTVIKRFSSVSFRETQLSFILKVLLLSAALSVLIKYGGSHLPIAPLSLNALIAILAPAFILAIALGWRAWNYR